MHISTKIAGGFHWKRFKFIVNSDKSLQRVEVPIKVQPSGFWPLVRYEIILPDEIPFKEATYVTARLGEVIRQAKDPSFFQPKRGHHIAISFLYNETEQLPSVNEERDIRWDQNRAVQALKSFAGWWFERTGERSSVQTVEETDQTKVILITNQATPSTAAKWTISDVGVEILMIGTNAETMEMLLGHITQVLSGSVWSGEKYSR